MKIISSYGVELRKQNIPIRQTLEIYRSAVRYLVEVYESVWEEMQRNIWCIQRNGIRPGLTLISAFPGCHPISDGRQSSMRLGVYLLIGRVWNSGKQRDRKQESRI